MNHPGDLGPRIQAVRVLTIVVVFRLLAGTVCLFSSLSSLYIVTSSACFHRSTSTHDETRHWDSCQTSRVIQGATTR